MKLCHAGYMYTVKATTNTSLRWECSQRTSFNCPGLIRVDINNPQVILSQTGHSHPGSDGVVRVNEIKQEIKAELIQTAAVGGSTHRTLCNNLSKLTREER